MAGGVSLVVLVVMQLLPFNPMHKIFEPVPYVPPPPDAAAEGGIALSSAKVDAGNGDRIGTFRGATGTLPPGHTPPAPTQPNPSAQT